MLRLANTKDHGKFDGSRNCPAVDHVLNTQHYHHRNDTRAKTGSGQWEEGVELCLCCPSAHFLIGSSSRAPGRLLWALVDGRGREGGMRSTTREEFSELPPQNEGIAPIAWGAFHNLLHCVQSPLLPRKGRDGGRCSASK